MPKLLAWDQTASDQARFARKLGGIFLCVAAILVAGIGAYLLHQQTVARERATQELSAVADLKLHEIETWRQERLADARFFSHARFVSEDVQRLFEHADAESRTRVLGWLSLLKGIDRYYAARIFDAQFQRRLSLPEAGAPPSPETLQSFETVAQTGELFLGDLRRDAESGLVTMDLIFPVFADPEQRTNRPIAVVLLKLDASRFLFPLVRHWPTPSRTAETLLVRREGNEVLYLNDLRHRHGAALTLRLPMTSSTLPAARILRGETSVMEGIDYRGVPVVAAGRLVPGTPWGMVAKMDRAELYAPLRRQVIVAGLFLVTLLVAAALLIALVWRQRSAQFLQQQLALERERATLADRLALLMRNANDIILVLDPTGRVVEANYCALQHYGYSAQEMQQLHLRDLRAPESLPDSERDFERLSSEGAVSMETVHRRKDGTTFAVEVNSRKLSANGRSFILTIARDVTERQAQAREIARLTREAEETLIAANARLEATVAQKTQELRDANANLEAFAFNAAHDLRSPLRYIQGFATLLLEDYGPKLDAQAHTMLERLGQSVDLMSRLLNDLLEYSRISQAQLKLEPVSLKRVVDEVLALLAGDIRSRDATVSVTGSLPEVLAHWSTAVLVINNLVSNALKFVPPGVKPQVRIRAEKTEVRVRLWVEDNGLGIAAKDQERIFDPFERLHNKQDYPGTGLGLAIVRKGAQRMGGRAGVESEPGQGSRFWIELPAA